MSALFNMPAGVFGQPPTARQIAKMERSIFARVRAEQEFASDDAPKAG
jgi:hypothetical protein